MIKSTERDIIRYLRKGKRINISQIARELDLPISTVSDRIKRIEKKFITKRISLINNKKAGYHSSAFVAVKTSEQDMFLQEIEDDSAINSIYLINSGFNYLVEIICKDNLEIYNWIEQIKRRYKAEVQTFHVFKAIAKENFIY